MFSTKPHQNVFKNVLFLSLKIIILTFIFKIDLASSTLSDFDQEEIISSFQRMDITNSEFGTSTTWYGEEPINFYQGDFTRIHYIATLIQSPAYPESENYEELSYPLISSIAWNVGFVPYFSTHYQAFIDNQSYSWVYFGWMS